jgi:2-methylcitrate dehydratase
MAERNDKTGSSGVFDRRDLMKLGMVTGVAAAMAAPAMLAAQQTAAPTPLEGNPVLGANPADTDKFLETVRGSYVQKWPLIMESKEVVTSTGIGYTVHTGAGWKNNSGRHGGNGPMDITTTRLAEWTASVSDSMITADVERSINHLMLDYLACHFSGYETDAGRAAARLAQRYSGSELKATVYGYNISTTPEMAAFANGGMGRLTDFDDHNSILVASCIAMGEALHSSGKDVMRAIAIAFEIQSVLGATRFADSPTFVQFDNWDLSVDVACACGHLLGLNPDYLGNAISIALLPHMPMYSRIGVQTNWKGFHAAEQGRNGLFAALIARDGMTGPPMPFEGRDGLIAHQGPYGGQLRLPVAKDGTLAIANGHGKGRGGYKRYEAEGTTQTWHGSIVQPLRAWAKADEIDALELTNTVYSWQEICDPTKWDPQNRETADHSFPYEMARSIIDGYIYYDSFFRDKYLDPKARELMAKITVKPDPMIGFENPISVKVRKKSGEERTFVAKPEPPFGDEEIVAKYKKSADFFKISNGDEIMQTWTNFKDVKDIGTAVAVLKQFRGYAPRSLSDMSPSANS